MSTSEVTCSNPYLDPILCSDPIGAYIATSIRVIVYMIQILAQLTLFRARFYQAFKGSALAVSNTKQKMLTIFISILIFLLLFGYILLMIYFATNISSSLLMIGILMYVLGLLFYVIVSFILLKMFTTKLVSLSLIIPSFNMSTNEINLAMSQSRTPSETSMETKENSSKENSSKINTVTIQTSIDFDVATADKENGNIGGAKMKNVSSVKQIELVKILGVTSRIFLLSVIGLLSTSLISVIQLILTNMSSGYILTRISDGLMVIDSLIGCICVYLTFDFAQAHFEKCIICSYCSFLCNKIIVNKRQKQIKNQQENKTVESN
eukprot:202229_1